MVMRVLLLGLAALLAACASRPGPAEGGAENPPPLFSLAGEGVALDGMLDPGKRTIMVFITAWCRICREEQPKVEAFARANKADTRVVYVVVGSPVERAAKTACERNIQVPVYVDPFGRFSDHLAITSTPTLIEFEPGGRVANHYSTIEELPGRAVELRAVTDSGREIGTSYEVVVLAADEETARRDLSEARKVVHELELQLSEWREDSQLSRLNRQAGFGAVHVGGDLLKIITASREISKATDGAFDITWLPLKELWDGAVSAGRVPEETELREALKAVGYENIEVEGSLVRFRNPRTRIGLGGVGKGWIVDAVFHHLRKCGYENIIVNIGGDLRTCGAGPDGPWTFTIADPYEPLRAAGKFVIIRGSFF